jgi:type I restriction-modification system DNA methylase subunit
MMQGRYTDQDRYAGQLEKVLQPLYYSGPAWRLWDDFLEMVWIALSSLPEHLKSAMEHGRLAEDSPEVQQKFAQWTEKYKQKGMERFSEGFAILLNSATEGYGDVIGATYELMSMANKWAGQYFTPLPICAMMAKMNDPMPLIHQHLKEALSHPDNVAGQALLLASFCLQNEENPEVSQDYFLNKVLPAALPYYEPVTVCDPALGSGRMLIAMAAECERWAVENGLIEFFGMDVDERCVQMAKINFVLHGIVNRSSSNTSSKLIKTNNEPSSQTPGLPLLDLPTVKRNPSFKPRGSLYSI